LQIAIIMKLILIITLSVIASSSLSVRDGGAGCSERESLLFIERQLDLEVLYVTKTRSSCVVKMEGLSR
jgi:hypothetical protein